MKTIDPYLLNDKILKNKLGLTSQEDLESAEADYATLRLRELAEQPLKGDFNAVHYLKVHKYIFQDLYDWAGKIRIVDIYKDEPVLGGLSIEYEKHDKILESLSRELSFLNKIKWSALSNEEIAKMFSHSLARIWQIHCFREGNTRTTVTFMCQFADERIKRIDRKTFENNAAFLRTALVAYCANFGKSRNYSKKEYLEKIVSDVFRQR